MRVLLFTQSGPAEMFVADWLAQSPTIRLPRSAKEPSYPSFVMTQRREFWREIVFVPDSVNLDWAGWDGARRSIWRDGTYVPVWVER